MEQHNVEVTPAEFETALRIWLRTAPKAIEARYVRWLKLAEQKRQSREDMVDLPREFAAVARAKLVQAGWKIVRRPIEPPASPPPWSGYVE
jgi:hypothetical protein